MNEKLTAKLKSIPVSPGVYLMKNINGDIIYVGKAKKLKKRVSQYFSGKNVSIKTEHLISKICDIETIVSQNELDAFLLENTLIKRYKPKYNISLKDDKSYPYIKIASSKTGFPYIIKTRNFKKGEGEYFGPYSSVFAVTQVIKTVNKIFKIRTCSENKFNSYAIRKKYCLYYQIGRCSAPCCGYVDDKAYGKSIDGIRLLLNGKNRQLLKELKRSMNIHVKRLNFEAAIKLRDKINAIITISEKQTAVFKNEKDMDVMGFYSLDGKADVVVVIVRDGRIIGTKNFFFKNVYLNDGEMLAAFLDQYYLKNLEISANIPDEILIPIKIEDEDKDCLVSYVKQFSSKNVKVIYVESGKRHRYDIVTAMAIENAKKNFMEKFYADEEANSAVDNNIDIHGKKYIDRDKDEDANGIVRYALIALKSILHLNKVPDIIECFDISNISGTYAVASKAVFNNGVKDTSLYRRYRIKSKNTPDDYAMMYEVLCRRFNNAVNGKDPLPDIIMVDGGKGQLNVLVGAAKEFRERNKGHDIVKTENMPVLIAIAKTKVLKMKTGEPLKKISETDKIYMSDRKNEVNFGRNKNAIFLLMRLRDEAHRVALTYFSKLKTKSLITSELLNIDGVGKKTYINLTVGLGSIENIKNSSIEELSAVKGISKKAARNIYDYFNL
ncbi:excinuclease ABC subunit UvrC [Candidatus Acidulodesulfobacterium sp. H_13]|uniref:excinuclease ABC subunit UvrC n=1 Tax=Candidatus Acidulodesulfobacterium sp. H_13 TaxID=3395470 RepID=UPI003AF86F3E